MAVIKNGFFSFKSFFLYQNLYAKNDQLKNFENLKLYIHKKFHKFSSPFHFLHQFLFKDTYIRYKKNYSVYKKIIR